MPRRQHSIHELMIFQEMVLINVYAFSIIALGAVAIAAPAAAQSNAEAVLKEAKSCVDLEKDKRRLACYDRVLSAAAVSDISEAGDDTTAMITVELDSADSFGNEALEAKRKSFDKNRLQSITASVAEIKKDPYKKLTISLENGQVWKQLDSDNKISLPNPDKAKSVIISRRALGSYRMQLEPIGKLILVRRIE